MHFNSLNYVQSTHELAEVFCCVAQHLRAGGLFTFDTLTHRGMQDLSGRYLHAVVNSQRFAIHCEYDPHQHKEESTVLLRAGVEKHCRIPIDPEDVIAVATQSGLEMEE